MENKEYVDFAIDMVIDFAAEQGLKYRRGDFSDPEVLTGDKNKIGFISDGTEITGLYIALLYNFERCGAKLKNIKNRFLNYINARVRDFGIVFTFSFKELEFEFIKGNKDEKNDKIEKIIAKVSKLLELSDLTKNPSEAEAIAASMKAQELLAKYNLDISVITGEEKSKDIEQVVSDTGKGKKWRYGLAETIARSYCCRIFYIGTEQVVFYGYKSDVLIARRIFVYLFEVGNRLANAYVKERRENEGNTKGIYNSFCSGFVNGVDRELSRNCTALVLVVPQIINESFAEFSKGFGEADYRVKTNDFKAYKQGEIEGKRALNAQYIEGDVDIDKQSFSDTRTY